MRPCWCSYCKGSQVLSCLVLASRSVLVLSQPSDISDLVPARLVLIIPTKFHVFCCITNCLSQAYGCSDHYKKAEEAEKSTWTGQMVVTESIEELNGLIRSHAT